MNCKRIRNIIITDYIDAELSPGLKEAVEKHLQDCQACRDYKNHILQNVAEPFRHAEKAEVPESVWKKIKEELAEKNAEVPVFSLKEKLNFFFGSGKPVLALTSTLAVIVIAIGLMRIPEKNQPEVNDYISEQISNYCILEPDGQAEDCAEFGSLIEDYFL